VNISLAATNHSGSSGRYSSRFFGVPGSMALSNFKQVYDAAKNEAEDGGRHEEGVARSGAQQISKFSVTRVHRRTLAE